MSPSATDTEHSLATVRSLQDPVREQAAPLLSTWEVLVQELQGTKMAFEEQELACL